MFLINEGHLRVQIILFTFKCQHWCAAKPLTFDTGLSSPHNHNQFNQKNCNTVFFKAHQNFINSLNTAQWVTAKLKRGCHSKQCRKNWRRNRVLILVGENRAGAALVPLQSKYWMWVCQVQLESKPCCAAAVILFYCSHFESCWIASPTGKTLQK